MGRSHLTEDQTIKTMLNGIRNGDSIISNELNEFLYPITIFRKDNYLASMFLNYPNSNAQSSITRRLIKIDDAINGEVIRFFVNTNRDNCKDIGFVELLVEINDGITAFR